MGVTGPIRAVLAAGMLAASLLSVGAARAQVPLTPVEETADRSTLVDELVVTARLPGPAIWRARRGDSEVIVLGAIMPLPHNPPWDTSRFDRLLTGAREVLTPPTGQVGVMDAASIALTAGRLKQGRGKTLEGTLPGGLRGRYLDVISTYHLEQKRYDNWKPAAAGFLMLSDFREKIGLSSAKPASTVIRMAKARKIRIRTVGGGSLITLFNGAKGLSDEQNNVCLRQALNEIEKENELARPTAAAWAQGDLETVRANYSAPTLEACLLQLPSYRTVVSRGVAEATAALDEALNKPGKTVAVVDLNFLLRADGVLDQLKARGAELSLPH